MILAIILLLIVLTIVTFPRSRGHGRCPECGIGTLYRSKAIKTQYPLGFIQRMTLACDMCGTVVIDGTYQPKPHPHSFLILEGEGPPPPPADESWSEVVKGG